MIIPDINMLLYAHLTAFPEHTRARRWWQDLMNGDREVGLTAPTTFGFVRIATNPRIFTSPMSVEGALALVESWLECPPVRFLVPGPEYLQVAFRMLRAVGSAANLTTDVQIAAFALEVQGEVHSSDTDFGRFPGLRWFNPTK
ncbi:MAG: type II toxin-antitoxin system VapC family toxin [Deltaproteobacteria bacterium]|nr:type II toxin-antitoxin system VapC family toxin [Deltaproteobacteria bacterium]